MSPLSRRGHVRALQIPSRKRDDFVPEAERYDDRYFSIDNRKSLIEWAIRISFLVGTIVALCVVDRKIFESINHLQRILKKYETNVQNSSPREAVPVDRVQLSFRIAHRLSRSLRKTDGAFFSRY